MFMLYTINYDAVWQRIKDVLNEKGINDSQLRDGVGAYDQKWRNWKKRGIPGEYHYSVAKFLGIYMEWLIAGEGNKYKAGNNQIQESMAAYSITAKNDNEKRCLKIYRSMADFQQEEWLAEGQDKVDLYNKFNDSKPNQGAS